MALPLHDIRQADTQLAQLAHDRNVANPPPGSPAVIVSERLTVAPDAAAADPATAPHNPAGRPAVRPRHRLHLRDPARRRSAVTQRLRTGGRGAPTGS